MLGKKYRKYWIFTFALILILIIRIFICDVFLVPTCSMEDAILEHEYILTNKYIYGFRLPDLNSTNGWNYKRYNKIKLRRNDIVVFNAPLGKDHQNKYYFPPYNARYIKRCVGLPGETIKIILGELFISNKPYKPLPTIKRDYKISISNYKCYNNIIKLFNNNSLSLRDDGIYAVASEEQLNYLIAMKCVKNINKIPLKNFNFYNKNDDSIIIPKKGLKIIINANNYNHYNYVIKVYEGNDIYLKNDSVFINDKYSKGYCFKMDYYFMLGDNMPFSSDSRFFGFVPEDHIIGKAEIILFSIDQNKTGLKKIRFSRLFNIIN
jgi:signal peptidase I